MSAWAVVDCFEPLEADDVNPRLEVESELELRAELQRLRRRQRHGSVMVESPDGNCLTMSLGGEVASLGWLPSLDRERVRGRMEALPKTGCVDRAIENWSEGVPTLIEARRLFPVDEVIEAAVYFFHHRQVPNWLDWQAWDLVAHKWEPRPATLLHPVSG